MNFRELHACTRSTLSGSYRRAFWVSLLYPAGMLVFRLIPPALAGVLITQDRMTAGELLVNVPFRWILFSGLWAVLRFCTLLPLQLGTYSWMLRKLGLSQGHFRFRSVSGYFRALRYFLYPEAFRTIMQLPVFLGLTGAAAAFAAGIGQPESGMQLFLASQALCLAAVCWLWSLYVSLGLAAMPFLYLRSSKEPASAAVRKSFRIMHGRRLCLIRIFLETLPAAVPLVTLPFLLPYLMMHYTLFLEISIRETMQEEEQHARPDFSYAAAGTVQT